MILRGIGRADYTDIFRPKKERIRISDGSGKVLLDVRDCGCKFCVGHNDEIDNCGFVGKPICVCDCICPDKDGRV